MGTLGKLEGYAMKFVTSSALASARVPARSLSALLLLCLGAPLAAAQRDEPGPAFHPLPLALAEALPGADAGAYVDMARFEEVPDIDSQRAHLQALEQDLSPYDPLVAEAALTLGRTLQALGRDADAIVEFERARQVLRVNEGLQDLDQVPVLDALIASHLALAQVAAADSLHEARFQLIQSAPTATPRQVADAALQLADWNVRRFLQDRTDNATVARAEATARLISTRLDRAYNLYAQALQLQRTDRSTTREFLTDIERRIAGLVRLVSSELQADSQVSLTRLGENSRQRSRQTPNRLLFKDGTTALQRAVAYHLEDPAPDVVEAAKRMLELGDWYLLLDERSAAIQTYEEALALLEAAPAAATGDAALLGSGLPVSDPALSYSADTPGAQDYEGYIDVEFEVNRFGKASHAHVLASSSDERELQRTLLRRIRAGTFRPGFEGASVLAQHRVQLRYYYSR